MAHIVYLLLFIYNLYILRNDHAQILHQLVVVDRETRRVKEAPILFTLRLD